MKVKAMAQKLKMRNRENSMRFRVCCCNRSGVQSQKKRSFFHVSFLFLGRLLQANELALVCSLIGVSHRDLAWSEPSDTSKPKKDSSPSHQWCSYFLSPYALHYYSVKDMSGQTPPLWHSYVLLLHARYTIGQQEMANVRSQMIVSNTCYVGWVGFSPWTFYWTVF